MLEIARERGAEDSAPPSEYELAQGHSRSIWTAVPIRDVTAHTFGGGTPSTSRLEFWDGDIPWTTTAVIGEHDTVLGSHQRNITAAGLAGSAAQVAPSGSVLLGTRVGVGKVVVTHFDVAVNQDITVLIPGPNLDPGFLVLVLKTAQMRRWFKENKRGTTIKGVPRSDVLSLTIPLPPLPEQCAIARVLRTVQRAREATDAVLASTHALKQSLMRHLFTYGTAPIDQADQVPLKDTPTGRLPEHWEFAPLGALTSRGDGAIQTGPFGSLLHASDYVADGVPFVMPKDLSPDGRIIASGVARIGDRDYRRLARYHLEAGDVLVARRGELGRRGLVKAAEAGWICGTGCLIIRPGRLLASGFLAHTFGTSWLREWLAGHAVGSTMANLSAEILARLPIPVPSVEEQTRITRMLSAADSKLHAEETRKSALSSLFNTLLHDLMTGRRRVYDLELNGTEIGGVAL